MLIPLVIQHRHVHLSKSDLRQLFGEEKKMEVEMELGQRGQVLYAETVSIDGKNCVMEHVRILGPSRSKTQVEISTTDAVALGIRAPLRQSGDLLRAGSCKIIGKNGSIRATSTVIVPARHLHCNEKIAKKLKLKNQDVVSLECVDRPNLKLNHVFVRVHPTFVLEFHLNEDEAAELWLSDNDTFTVC